jgi:predicted enzyme related to lactoylglutathione lyase
MGRPVVRWELWSEDPDRLADFYREVFDCEIRHLPEMDYRLVETGGDGGIDGGMMTPQQGPWPGNMAFYIDVDDLETYAERIGAAGGTVVVEAIEVPGVGWMSLFEDPDGRALGMWKRLE